MYLLVCTPHLNSDLLQITAGVSLWHQRVNVCWCFISFCPPLLIVNPVRKHLILAFNKENTVCIIKKTNFGRLCFFGKVILLILVNYILDHFFFVPEIKWICLSSIKLWLLLLSFQPRMEQLFNVVHLPCNCPIHSSLHFQFIAQYLLFSATTFCGHRIWPSSGSYKLQTYAAYIASTHT
jgi:hypothetical protein